MPVSPTQKTWIWWEKPEKARKFEPKQPKMGWKLIKTHKFGLTKKPEFRQKPENWHPCFPSIHFHNMHILRLWEDFASFASPKHANLYLNAGPPPLLSSHSGRRKQWVDKIEVIEDGLLGSKLSQSDKKERIIRATRLIYCNIFINLNLSGPKDESDEGNTITMKF